MSGIKWGIPTKRRGAERFDTPTISMSAITGLGVGRKFEFNKAARKELNLNAVIGTEEKTNRKNEVVEVDKIQDTYVALGFEGTNVYVKALTEEFEGSFHVTKSFTFSNKKMHGHVAKLLGLSIYSENHLHLSAVEGEEGLFKVDSVTSDEPSEEAIAYMAENNEEEVETEEMTETVSESSESSETLETEEVAETPVAEEPVVESPSTSEVEDEEDEW